MPDTSFTITPTAPTSLKLAIGELGTFSFTVTSLAAPDIDQEVIAQALVIAPEGRKKVDWVVAQPQRALILTGGETETVTINVRPTAKSPPGEHSITLALADKSSPNDDVVYSARVTCEVVATAPAPVLTPSAPSRPWLIPMIAGGVVLLGVAVFALIKGFALDSKLSDQAARHALELKSAIPEGVILAWYSKASAPRGWAICDGQNGTPDLRKRFLRGVGSAEPVGKDAVGGNETHDHTASVTLRAGAKGGSDWEWHRTVWASGPNPAVGGDAATGKTDVASNLPPYADVLYIMKLKE